MDTPAAPTFTRQGPSSYVADLDDDSGVLRWLIMKTADRRWEIISVTTGWERRRHGAAYTLREAKESVGVFHRSNLAMAARETPAAAVPHRLTAQGFFEAQDRSLKARAELGMD